MADIFTGSAPPSVTTTTATKAEAPKYLTDYLSDLASAGQTQLGKTDLVAPLTFNQQKAYDIAPTLLSAFQPALTAAQTAGEAGGKAVSPEDIQRFYNPYQQSVLNEQERQAVQTAQRSLLPQLEAGFVGTGGLGGQRYASALGQTIADVQSNLLGQQAATRAAGFKSALDAALQQKQIQNQAAQALTGVGTGEQQAVTSGLQKLSDLGAQEQAYGQAKIEAPLTRASNVAQLLRGYTYPTTTTQTYTGPASAYQPSPLAQIAGLGSLLGSAFNTSGGFGNKFIDFVSGKVGNLFNTNPTGYGTTGTNPIAPSVGSTDGQQTYNDLMNAGGL